MIVAYSFLMQYTGISLEKAKSKVVALLLDDRPTRGLRVSLIGVGSFVKKMSVRYLTLFYHKEVIWPSSSLTV